MRKIIIINVLLFLLLIFTCFAFSQKEPAITLPFSKEITKLSFLNDWEGGFFHSNNLPRFCEERVIANGVYRLNNKKILINIIGRSKDADNNYYFGELTVGALDLDDIWIKRYQKEYSQKYEPLFPNDTFSLPRKMYLDDFFCEIQHDYIINCGYISMSPFKFDNYKAKFYVFIEYFNMSVREIREIIPKFPFKDLKKIFAK